jgi:hypothetical protein
MDWKGIAKGRPYCRPAIKGAGLAPTPDADALALRDAFLERLRLEKRAGLKVMRCFWAWRFRKVLWEKWAGSIIARFWRTANIGLLRVLRLYKKVMRTRKFKRNFFLNALATHNAGLIMQRLARGAVARVRARLRAKVVSEAAIKIQRMLRRHWDWVAYFREMAKVHLEMIQENERYGFNRPKLYHHKPTHEEAKDLRLVKQVPGAFVRSPSKLTHDGTPVYDDTKQAAMGTSLLKDMDVRRAFKAEEKDLNPPSPVPYNPTKRPSTAERLRRSEVRRPLAMPPLPRSYYT